MSGALEEVGRAADAAHSATAQLRAVIAEASAAGESIADLARAAGVTRQTIYRWLAQEGSSSHTTGDPEDAIREALAMMATHLDTHQSGELLTRAQMDTATMLRALHMGRRWIADIPLAEHEQAILGLATEAQNQLAQRS